MNMENANKEIVAWVERTLENNDLGYEHLEVFDISFVKVDKETHIFYGDPVDEKIIGLIYHWAHPVILINKKNKEHSRIVEIKKLIFDIAILGEWKIVTSLMNPPQQ